MFKEVDFVLFQYRDKIIVNSDSLSGDSFWVDETLFDNINDLFFKEFKLVLIVRVKVNFDLFLFELVFCIDNGDELVQNLCFYDNFREVFYQPFFCIIAEILIETPFLQLTLLEP